MNTQTNHTMYRSPEMMYLAIGACRAVWVPGQDLAMPHLMHNCRKHILSLHCTLYVRLCTHVLYAGDHVSSRLVLAIGVCMIQNNPGNAQVGLQAPIYLALLQCCHAVETQGYQFFFMILIHEKQALTNHISLVD